MDEHTFFRGFTHVTQIRYLRFQSDMVPIPVMLLIQEDRQQKVAKPCTEPPPHSIAPSSAILRISVGLPKLQRLGIQA